MNKLVLVISGQIVRENSANLMNFWRGFINIQRAIHNINELKIVAHSWNPEFDELVRNVYNVDILESEVQKSFVKEYMPLLDPIDRFENGLKRFNSTWKRVSCQAILGNATSRTKAINLLHNLNLKNDDKILALRWDIGCTGSKEVNSINFDNSLDENYLYISYYSEVDEGYADMWFIAPYQYTKKFENYKDYVLECFSGKNNYFNNFTKNGWHLAISKNEKSFFINQYKNAILRKILIKFPFGLFKKILPFLSNKITGLQQKIKNIIETPQISGENSLLFEMKTDVKFPNYQALNNHAILKSFIKDNNLREDTRFLDIKDFENLPKGQMINPIYFCYIIYSHSSFDDCWKMAINQAKENLPSNCKKIYLVSEDSDDTKEKFTQYNFEDVELVTYNSDSQYTDRLIEIFAKITDKFNLCYFVHEDMPLISSVDEIYLNTLLHFMNNSNEYYIKLVDTSYVDQKESHDSFPGLVKNMGGYSISVQASLMKLDHMISFLTNFHTDIYGYELLCTRSNFTFSAVQGTKKIGKYLLFNESFPHISTAISKGKWCTSEWKNEIEELSKKYNIDLSLRGEC
ncbi:hypothetical protein [Aliarcobacter butzleri]|uniref:hypothetical protein n=1 Tax=Aliarcobacter butzleri TaxID=28197 RepID=UPI002B24921A|nr:hypothetical protein [Aliarcobacter butzleri]